MRDACQTLEAHIANLVRTLHELLGGGAGQRVHAAYPSQPEGYVRWKVMSQFEI